MFCGFPFHSQPAMWQVLCYQNSSWRTPWVVFTPYIFIFQLSVFFMKCSIHHSLDYHIRSNCEIQVYVPPATKYKRRLAVRFYLFLRLWENEGKYKEANARKMIWMVSIKFTAYSQLPAKSVCVFIFHPIIILLCQYAGGGNVWSFACEPESSVPFIVSRWPFVERCPLIGVI